MRECVPCSLPDNLGSRQAQELAVLTVYVGVYFIPWDAVMELQYIKVELPSPFP